MNDSESQPVIAAKALSKTFTRGREQVHAVRQVSFTIFPGEFVAITGPSGAGKTTLLNLIGCMETIDAGELHLLGKPVHEANDRQRTRIRRDQLGFVFQHFGLIPTLTVAQNVALPGLFARRPAGARVQELLKKVGLERRQNHRPHELSGGEMQRAAIARALVNKPALLLADEPTGNLDSTTGDSIIALFKELNQDGLTIVAVTHNVALAKAANRELRLVDGKLVDQRGEQNTDPGNSREKAAGPQKPPAENRLRVSNTTGIRISRFGFLSHFGFLISDLLASSCRLILESARLPNSSRCG